MLSAIILTKNEATKIDRLIKNLSFASEIIIIDDHSTDKTPQLAKKLGARVFSRHLNNNFAEQRNFGLKKAKNEWVLFIDADETVSPQLAKEIISRIKDSQFVGFYINRKERWLGKTMTWGEWSTLKIFSKYGHNSLLRLGKKDAGKWFRRVHEYWEVHGPVSELNNALVHNKDKSLRKIIDTLNFQAKLHNKANSEEGKKSSILRILTFPLAKFSLNYFVKQGFRDGIHGFVYATLMSFHSFLAWSQLYLTQNQK